jgi:hypothetical protein
MSCCQQSIEAQIEPLSLDGRSGLSVPPLPTRSAVEQIRPYVAHIGVSSPTIFPCAALARSDDWITVDIPPLFVGKVFHNW